LLIKNLRGGYFFASSCIFIYADNSDSLYPNSMSDAKHRNIQQYTQTAIDAYMSQIV